jgi:hypothetical protein
MFPQYMTDVAHYQGHYFQELSRAFLTGGHSLYAAMDPEITTGFFDVLCHMNHAGFQSRLRAARVGPFNIADISDVLHQYTSSVRRPEFAFLFTFLGHAITLGKRGNQFWIFDPNYGLFEYFLWSSFYADVRDTVMAYRARFGQQQTHDLLIWDVDTTPARSLI